MSLNKRTDKLLDLFDEFLGDFEKELDQDEEKEALPYQILSLPEGKSIYVLEPTKKIMVLAKHHTECVQISFPDENGKVIVRSLGGEFLLVPQEYVREIGFN